MMEVDLWSTLNRKCFFFHRKSDLTNFVVHMSVIKAQNQC